MKKTHSVMVIIMEILKLKPVFKDYIWGGTRLRDDFGFECDVEPIAEGWMLACHKDGKKKSPERMHRLFRIFPC